MFNIAQTVALCQDMKQASDHIAAITQCHPDTAIIDIRMIHDSNRGVPAIPMRGMLPQLWSRIQNYQSHGYGCFININDMDGNGHSTENVRACRVAVVDLDNEHAQANFDRACAWSPAPQFFVNTSPGKWHVYWQTSYYAGNDYFTLRQRKLRQWFDGDKSVIDPTRVLRLAGTLHLKRPEAPHLVTIGACGGWGAVTDNAALDASLAHINVIDGGSGTRHPLGDPALSAPSLAYVQRVLDLTDPNTERDEWVSITSAIKQSAWLHADEATIRSMWDAWCTRYDGNNPAENDKLWRSIRDTEVGWPALVRRRPELIVDKYAHIVMQEPPASLKRGDLFWLASDLDGLAIPERQWLVEGFIPDSTVTLLSGDGGVGKSLLALQLAADVTQGCHWLRKDTKAGNALFISAEDDRDELHRRIADIARNTRVSLSALRGLTVASLAGGDALLAELRTGGALAETALYNQLYAKMMETRPALVVLDTLADLFPGDENNRVQARQFIGLLRRLAIEHSCAVVMLAHPSLTGINAGTGTSGSTGWNNSVRSRLYFERDSNDPDLRRLKIMKSNYGQIGEEIELRWQAGIFVEPIRGSQSDRQALADSVFMDLMEIFQRTGQTLHPTGGSNYFAKLFADHEKAKSAKIRKDDFKVVCQRLLEAGKIIISVENAGDGRSSKRLKIAE